MSDTKPANQGAVTSIGDTDLVMCVVNGSYHPISFANFMKAVKTALNQSLNTSISLTGGEWVRVAQTRAAGSTFFGILSVSHGWSSGAPCPLVCVINGSAANKDGFCADQLTSGTFYAPKTNNQGLSFTAVRFVKESDAIYIEVKFKANSKTGNILSTLFGNSDISLVQASVSTASSDNVMKTIEFSGGGISNCQSASYIILSDKVPLRGRKGGLRDGRDKGTYWRFNRGEADTRPCVSRSVSGCESLHFVWHMVPAFYSRKYTKRDIPKCPGMPAVFSKHIQFSAYAHPDSFYPFNIRTENLSQGNERYNLEGLGSVALIAQERRAAA